MNEGTEQWELRAVPRTWQNEALVLWKERFRGVVSVVTGAGKSVFAQMCMLVFRERYPDGRFVIVVPTIALIDQWVVSLQEDLGVAAEQIACFSGEERPTEPRTVNLITINSARTLAPTLCEGKLTFLIVDECHRAGSPMNSLALRGDYRAYLGLSATPERDYDCGFEERITPILGGIVYRYGYKEAHRDRVISHFGLVNLQISFLPDEEALYAQLSARLSKLAAPEGRSGNAKLEDAFRKMLQLRAAVVGTAALRVPVAVKLVEEHEGQRSLVFHERISDATSILQTLLERGHKATIYHSQISPHVRRDNLRLYRQGVFNTIVTCRALDEGMNVPETAVAVVASATASNRQRIQRLGRALRPAPGKYMATIYTLYVTHQEQGRLLGESRRLGSNIPVSWQKAKYSSDG